MDATAREGGKPHILVDTYRVTICSGGMIKSFGNRETEALYAGTCPASFRAFRKAAERKLQMLESAASLLDLRSPRGNRLEKLARDRTGQYSIRINDQWRMCFRWRDGDAHEVEIVDYQ